MMADRSIKGLLFSWLSTAFVGDTHNVTKSAPTKTRDRQRRRKPFKPIAGRPPFWRIPGGKKREHYAFAGLEAVSGEFGDVDVITLSAQAFQRPEGNL